MAQNDEDCKSGVRVTRVLVCPVCGSDAGFDIVDFNYDSPEKNKMVVYAWCVCYGCGVEYERHYTAGFAEVPNNNE